MNLYDKWEFHTIIALLLFVSSVIIRKYLFNNKCNFNDFLFVYLLMMGIFAIFFSFFIYYIYKDNLFKDKKNNKKIILVTTLVSFLVILGIIFKSKGYYLVDNVAVLDGFMEPSKIILLFFASYFLLNTKFNIRILFGILVAILGMIIIIKNQ
mgnify:CR=1 FL=1|jgi:drug/metabolite transporter (DMT)-like permease